MICAIKSMSEMNNSYENPEVEFAGLMGASLGSGLVITIVYVVFAMIPYVATAILYNFINNYINIGPSNIILNIPFIWTVVVYYALLVFDYSPNVGTEE